MASHKPHKYCWCYSWGGGGVTELSVSDGGRPNRVLLGLIMGIQLLLGIYKAPSEWWGGVGLYYKIYQFCLAFFLLLLFILFLAYSRTCRD